MLHIKKKKVMLSYLVNELKDGLIVWGSNSKKILVATMKGHENGKTLC